jgi:hypothetical protein
MAEAEKCNALVRNHNTKANDMCSSDDIKKKVQAAIYNEIASYRTVSEKITRPTTGGTPSQQWLDLVKE